MYNLLQIDLSPKQSTTHLLDDLEIETSQRQVACAVTDFDEAPDDVCETGSVTTGRDGTASRLPSYNSCAVHDKKLMHVK